MGCLFHGKLFLRAEAAPVSFDDARTLLPGQRYRVVITAGIDDEDLVAEGERRQAGRQLLFGIPGDEDGGKWIHPFGAV
jgi:hypothetical protein